MKKWTAILALILALSLVAALLAACSPNETPSVGDGTQSSDIADTENTGASSGSGWISDEIVEVVLTYMDLHGKTDSYEDMVTEFNKITEERIGVRIKFMPVTLGDFSQKLGVAIAGGERIDLLMLCGSTSVNFGELTKNKSLMDITDYLQQDYAAGIMDCVGDNLAPYTIDGRIYGVPPLRDTAQSTFLVMRKDLLEEMELLEQAENVTTWAEYEAILRAAKAAYSDQNMYAVSNNDTNIVLSISSWLCSSYAERGAFTEGEYYDMLGDSLNLLQCTLDGTVSCWHASESFSEMCQMVADWMNEGLLYPDSAITELSGRSLMQNGMTFSCINTGEGQLATDFQTTTGYEVVCVSIFPSMKTTKSTLQWGTVVPVTSEEPEAAIALLNLLYTDADLINLLTYGIEGSDYTVNEEGEAVYSVADMKWKGSDWMIGNMFLTWPQAGTGGDQRAVRLEINKAQKQSPFNGFAIDTSDLDLVISQLSAVRDQYNYTLNAGGYTENLYQEYLAKLETAGIDEYVNAVQTQLDAWTSSQ